MPDVYGPFDNASWSQDQWYKFATTFAPSGVVGSSATATSPSAGSLGLTVSGLNITMALGRAWVYGAGYERTSTAFTAAIPANTNANPRRDRLVLRRDLGAKTVLPVVIQGTPAASPVAPAIQQNDTGQFDLTLFSWTTPGSSGAPLTNITDERLWVSPASGDGSTAFGFESRLAAPFVVPATTADVTGWALTGLTPGTWEVELEGGISSGVSGGVNLYLNPTAGLVIAPSGTAAGTSSSLRRYTAGPTIGPQDWASGTTAVAVTVSGSSSPAVFRITWTAVVTTGGTLQLRVGASTGGNVSVQQHTFARATRVG